MNWFDTNPYGANPSWRQGAAWKAHTFGRQQFASSFARQGFASTVFAPTPKEAFLSPFRKTHKYGSPEHISGLKRIAAAYPENSGVMESLKKASASAGAGTKTGLLSRVAGAGLMTAFIAMPAFTTPGSPKEKARAVAGGAAGFAGWEIGSKVGMGAGAAIGSLIPVVGTAIGAGVGYLAGGLLGAIGADEGFRSLSRIPDRMVERERSRRGLNWVNNQTAFMTQGAHTMRQQSLQAMNRGLMNSRSILGREGVMLQK
jgi:hypothetical protein